MNKPDKENIPGYISLGFIAVYCAFLIIIGLLSIKEHRKIKRDYIISHFGRLSDSKEVQDAYREKEAEQKTTRNRFYIDDNGKVQKYPVYESE